MKLQEIKDHFLSLAKENRTEPVKDKVRGLSQETLQLVLDIMKNPNLYYTPETLQALEDEIKRTEAHNYTYMPPDGFTRLWYAVCHCFGFHIYSTEFLEKLDQVNHSVFSGTGATYETDGLGIDDVAYANPKIKFGYVADGTGHNNPLMAKILNRIFKKFNEDYEAAIEQPENDLSDTEAWKSFVQKQLTTLGQAIHGEPEAVDELDPARPLTHMSDGTLKPAFSFAQVIKSNGKRELISAQFSDTILLIKKADGTFDTSLATRRDDYGIGDPFRKLTKKGVVQVTEVEKGDIVFGFTDGIGEFLSMDELTTIINANQNVSTLLKELKEDIIQKGQTIPSEDPHRRQRKGPSANQMGTIKLHDPVDPHNHDDISFFMLQVT